MMNMKEIGAFHYNSDLGLISGSTGSGLTSGIVVNWQIDEFTYTFENFFHPFVGQLIQQLNKTSIAGMLDPNFLATLDMPYTSSDYDMTVAARSFFGSVQVALQDKKIDVSSGGPYANYNWELVYHIPVMVAVHLSNNQRFAEAEKWFHLVFDPTTTDTKTAPPDRFWRCSAFRGSSQIQDINALLALLSTMENPPSAAQLADPRRLLRYVARSRSSRMLSPARANRPISGTS